MKVIYTLLIISIILSKSIACTVFTSNDGQNVFAASNEDFLNDRIPEIWFENGKNNEYGCAYWGYKYSFFKAKWIPQGGINNKGLFYDKTSVPDLPILIDKGKKNAGPFLLNSVLKKCATVDEAINYINQYNLKHFTKGQVLIADATGNYAIIENNAITLKDNHYYQ